MTLEYDMVLARPGYNEKYKKDVTWDELRDSFLLYKRVPMIVAGESHSGPIDPNEAVGFVDAKIDEDTETIRGKAIFFKETFDRIPNSIQRRLADRQHVPASLGYQSYDSLRKIDHLAIGVESPVFKDIGFHAESDFWYEETGGIGAEDEGVEVVEGAQPDEIRALRAEIDELRTQVAELTERGTPDEASGEQAGQEDEEKGTTEVEPEAPQPKPEVVPERTIPKEQSSKKKTTTDGLFELGSTRIVSTPIGAPDKKKGGT